MLYTSLKGFYKKHFRRYVYIVTMMRPRPKFDFDNVFVIGYNKTGTTSMNRFLTQLGMRHLGHNQHTKAQWQNKRYGYLLWVTKRINSFDDVPWNRMDVIERLMQLDQDSRFILTVRDPDKWFKSYQRFEKKIGRVPPPDDVAEKWKSDILLTHNVRCRELAKQYGRSLLEIDVTRDPDAKTKVCEFIGLDPATAPDFPHANRTAPAGMTRHIPQEDHECD